MKFRFLIFILCGFLLIGLIANSCKKSEQDNIAMLFTGDQWQLSSLTVTYNTGASIDSVVTLNTLCDSIQVFKFNTDFTCSYTNFECNPQSSKGNWSLSQDKLFLSSDMVCQDSLKKATKPFQTSKIINLGQYSLVLQTGDLETYYTPTQKRIVRQYGFVRVKTQ